MQRPHIAREPLQHLSGFTLASFERLPQHCTKPNVHVPSCRPTPLYVQRSKPPGELNKGEHGIAVHARLGCLVKGLYKVTYRHSSRVLLCDDFGSSWNAVPICEVSETVVS